ncbi:MAG: hypothetical protein O2868_08605 [Proteobacteria bacterium]|nr:hypothetical protein [Pseudomonadota bacterium]
MEAASRYLATSIADPHGHLTDKLSAILPALLERFDGVGAQVTSNTDAAIVQVLTQHGVVIDQFPSDFDAIGRHRRRALELALNLASGDDRVFYLDADHLLRWYEQDADELDGVLGACHHHDCTVIGRGPHSWQALPRRLKETEAVVNHMFFLLTGFEWDLMMAARGFSHRAARLIVDSSIEDTAANDVDWPLLCLSHGLSTQYLSAEGLIYQTNHAYAGDEADAEDSDVRAWAQRVRLANHASEAISRYYDAFPLH